MIDNSDNNCLSEWIDGLVRRKMPFAFFRKPGCDVDFMVQTSADVTALHQIGELNGCSGFVMAPFELEARHPIVLIRPDCTTPEALRKLLLEQQLPAQFQKGQEEIRQMDVTGELAEENGYVGRLKVFLDALRQGTFEKLVFSRKKQVRVLDGFSVGTAFQRACETYARAFVYVCYTPVTGLWLGSTPEILLSGADKQWRTVALAGTQALVNGSLPVCWLDKNREEQALVAAYIRDILQKRGIPVRETGPFTVQAGELAHLKTEFDFWMGGDADLTGLVEELHPTPAVCGLPKEKAFQFIRQHEGYDREYYSGFIGCWNWKERTDLFVNLRCMQWQEGRALLFAGGGILAASEVHDEWLETERKMQTMYRLIEKY